MYEFTEQQKKILQSTDKKIAVEASAASLKTSTLTEKVRFTLQDGIDPARIAVITYTRMAAEELRERLENDYKDGIFIGTIHALAARFMSMNGRGNLIKKYAEDSNFDEMFEECKDLNVSGVYDYIFLDEAQDISEGEITFVFDMLRPEHLMVVYDLKQSIYQFKGAKPELLSARLKSDNFSYYPLNLNFRNAPRILAEAKNIILGSGMRDLSTAQRNIQGIFAPMKFNKTAFINLLNEYDTYGDWAILTRDNRQLSKIGAILNLYDIPYVTFKQSQLTKEQLEKKMKSNTVKLITIHSSKGLGFKNVMVYGARRGGDEVYVSYVAATRAKDMLIWLSGTIK